MKDLIRKNILKLQAYSSARDEYKAQAEVYLDANENPFDNGINRYPDPYQMDLKQKISEIKNIPLDNIFLGNGSDEVLDLIIRIFCEPGVDNIIICPPTYGMYKVLADVNNIEIKETVLKDDFSLNSEEIIDVANEKTKLLMLCSPNNPSGNSIPNSELKSLLSVLNCMVLMDEAYVDFSDKESALSLLNRYPNLIVSQTLSKAWGMAGIRVGMAFASAEIIQVMNKVKPPYNINVLSQEMAIENLEAITLYERNLKTILSQKEWLINELRKFANVEKIYPSDANFLLVKFVDSSFVFRELQTRGIILRDRSQQVLCEQCLRITIGTEEENNKLITQLKEIIL